MSDHYDSRPDTRQHIDRVRHHLGDVIFDLSKRSVLHDKSKLAAPEVEVFDEFTPKLKDSTYGSDEYKGYLAAMKPALDHHYFVNDHHPEHFEDGVQGMNYLQLLELLCDWKAAGERHADGSFERSMVVNVERFDISYEMERTMRLTAEALGWL